MNELYDSSYAEYGEMFRDCLPEHYFYSCMESAERRGFSENELKDLALSMVSAAIDEVRDESDYSW